MRLAVYQFASTLDVADNLTVLESAIRSAKKRGADIVIFPESAACMSPPSEGDFARDHEPLDGPFVSRLREIVEQEGIDIVFGMFLTTDSGLPQNVGIYINSQGIVEIVQPKIHLLDAFSIRESDSVAPGELSLPKTVRWKNAKIGIQVCYDLRFPEVSRRLIDQGANVVIVPSCWVIGPGKEAQLKSLAHARAIENSCFVVVSNQVPPNGTGYSFIVDPSGISIATMNASEGLLLVDLDIDDVTRVRSLNPGVFHRRFSTQEAPC